MTGYFVTVSTVANHIRVTLEIGPKGKKVVAVAPGWSGLECGATTGEAVIERLIAYIPRYAAVTKLVGMDAAFASIDQQSMSGQELERELTLMRACWAFFGEVRSRVSAEMQRGRARSGQHRPAYAWRGAGLHEEGRCAHASGRDAHRRRIDRATRRLLRRNSGLAFPEQNSSYLAASVFDSAHGVSHARSRLGNGRQRSDGQVSVRPSASGARYTIAKIFLALTFSL